PALAHRGSIEEVERLAVPQNLVERLGHRGQVERRLVDRGVMEDELLAKDGLAAAGNADHQRDRVLEDPPVKDLVETHVTAREPVCHRGVVVRLAARASALVPRRSRTVDARISGSSGLRRNADAPTASASCVASMAATASTWAVPAPDRSLQRRKPAPPDINRSITTRSGDRSANRSRA